MSPDSPYGAWNTPGTGAPNPERYFALLAVSARLPVERPWKAPRNAIAFGRPVANRDSLSAASTASVPEFARNTRGSCTGALAPRRSQSSTYTGWYQSLEQ